MQSNSRQRKTVAVLSAAACLFIMPVMAQQSPDVARTRQEIEAKIASGIQAFKTLKTAEDLDTLHQSVDTPDFVMLAPGKKPILWETMREQMLENLRRHDPAEDFLPRSMSIESFSMPDAQTAITQGVGTESGTIVDREGAFGFKGDKHNLLRASIVRVTWVKLQDGWHRKIQELLGGKLLVDGKEFKPGAGAGAERNR